MLGPVPAPMLARLKSALPRGASWCYEPKFDGFRGLLWRPNVERVQLVSRNLKDLSSSFPELVQAGSALPSGTLVDGEIVIADGNGWSDFGALQERLVLSRRSAVQMASTRPAVLLVFDLLRHNGTDLMEIPLSGRRERLKALLQGAHPCLQVVAQTRDVREAEEWISLLPSIEGVVAKRADSRYIPGQRDWIKVKRQRTVECIVLGLAGDKRMPSLVLGLKHPDGEVHHFGITRASVEALNHPSAAILAQQGADETPIRSRWQHDAVPAWRRVPAVAVCEVSFTTLDAGRWLRQPARFLRWRPDRSPQDCLLEQLAQA